MGLKKTSESQPANYRHICTIPELFKLFNSWINEDFTRSLTEHKYQTKVPSEIGQQTADQLCKYTHTAHEANEWRGHCALESQSIGQLDRKFLKKYPMAKLQES